MAVQYSCLGNPMERGDWQAVVHGVAGVRHNWETRPPTPPPSTAACGLPSTWMVPHPLLRQDTLNSWLYISQGLNSTSAEQNQAIQHFRTNLIYFFMVCPLVKDEDQIRSQGSSWHWLGVLQCLSGTLSFMALLWKLEKSAISPRRLAPHGLGSRVLPEFSPLRQVFWSRIQSTCSSMVALILQRLRPGKDPSQGRS